MNFLKPKFWDYKKPNFVAFLLLPFTLPILISNYLKSFRVQKKIRNIKTVCIGNIYVGGTGKTPLAIKSNNLLKSNNLKSTIIKKFYHNQIDEQNLIKKYSNLICRKKRLDALDEALLSKFQYAIFDDGLQDKSINYDLKIVCFSNLQWIGNGLIIPAGPLREKINSILKYDAVVINGDTSLNKNIINEVKKIKKNLKVFETDYEISNFSELKVDSRYVIFSAIANPTNFSKILKKNNFKIEKEYIFPDHYIYRESDLTNILNYAKNKNLKVMTTEKDYSKIDNKYQNEISFIKLDLKILNEEKFVDFLKEEK